MSDKYETLDTRGLYCPEPIMMLHSRMDEIELGQVIKLLASDPATKRDVPKFCQFLGHILLSEEEKDQAYIYLIQKQKSKTN